jgi:hypothetical protein
MCKLRLSVCGAFALISALALGQPAQASLLNLGSSFNLSLTNAPNTTSETDMLTAGTTTVDGGVLSLNITSVPAPGGGEWEVFTFTTTSGGPIGLAVLNWEIALSNISLTQTLHATQFFIDWGTNGTLFSPTTNTGNLSVETNPITGSGNVLGESFSLNLSSVSFNASENPFDALAADGFVVASLNEFQAAFLVSTPTPLPAALPLFATGIGGLGLLGWSRKRKARAAA